MNLMISNLTLDSREVAEMISKNHADLLRDIRRNMEYFIESKIAFNDFFIESSYKDKRGRTLISFQITKKGCEFLAHKLTGKKGACFTATYINKFHEMENRLSNPQPTFTRLYWNNQPVMTVEMFGNMTGLSRITVNQALLKMGNTDVLCGADLQLFKSNNNNYKMRCNSLRIITSSVAKELARYLKLSYSILKDYFAVAVLNSTPAVVENKPKQVVTIADLVSTSFNLLDTLSNFTLEELFDLEKNFFLQGNRNTKADEVMLNIFHRAKLNSIK